MKLRSRRSAAHCLAPLSLSLPLLLGCGKGSPPVCPQETVAERFGEAPPGTPAVVSTKADDRSEGAPAVAGGPRKMILLLDYSGSMYGGYGKQAPKQCEPCAAGPAGGRGKRPYYVASADFQSFLSGWLVAATPPEGDLGLEVLLFNGKVWHLRDGGVRPFDDATPGLGFATRISRRSASEIAALLWQIKGNPYEADPGGKAPNTTDSPAALRSALRAIGDDDAVVWLITDNIVDTAGGANPDPDARATADFYRELNANSRLKMIAAYPIFLAEPCSWMCGSSLFVYGIYVSSAPHLPSARLRRLGGTTAAGGGPAPDGLLWNTALRQLAAEHSGQAAAAGRAELAGVPLRLKPIDAEALAIDFGRPALRCARAEFRERLRCNANLVVRNTLRHQVADGVALSLSNDILLPYEERSTRRLEWASAVCPGQVETRAWQVAGGLSGNGKQDIQIGRLAPLQEARVRVSFELPAVEVDTHRLSQLVRVALTSNIVLRGQIRAEVRPFTTSLALEPQKFASVYGSGALPAIFREHVVGTSTSASYPIDAQLANDGQALALLTLGGGGGLAALCALVAMRFQRKQLTVVVDGIESARLSLPRWSRRDVEVGGVPRALLRRGWGADYRLVPRSGVRLRRDGAAWVLRLGDDIGEEHRIEIRRGWSTARSRSLLGDHLDNW